MLVILSTEQLPVLFLQDAPYSVEAFQFAAGEPGECMGNAGPVPLLGTSK